MPSVYHPIKSITPVDRLGTAIGVAVTEIPIPSSYKWQLIDISAPDAGRTEDMAMNKMRRGQAVRVDLGWVYPTLAEASTVLNAFNWEYLLINYLDTKAGAWLDKRFVVGDRNAPLWNSAKGRWEGITFPIIQQIPDITTN